MAIVVDARSLTDFFLQIYALFARLRRAAAPQHSSPQSSLFRSYSSDEQERDVGQEHKLSSLRPFCDYLKNLMMDNARLYATVNSRHDELLFIVRYLNLRHRSLAG